MLEMKNILKNYYLEKNINKGKSLYEGKFK